MGVMFRDPGLLNSSGFVSGCAAPGKQGLPYAPGAAHLSAGAAGPPRWQLIERARWPHFYPPVFLLPSFLPTPGLPGYERLQRKPS